MWFKNAAEAFSFILHWDGKSVDELYDAILIVHASRGTLFAPYLENALEDLSRQHSEDGTPSGVIAMDMLGHCLTGEPNNLVIRRGAMAA